MPHNFTPIPLNDLPMEELKASLVLANYDGEQLADELLQPTGLSPADAARLVLELLESTRGHAAGTHIENLRHCRNVIQMGAAAYAKDTQSVSFHELLNEAVRTKLYNERRKRTVEEVMQYGKRIMRAKPAWRNKSVRSITAAECHELIREVFEASACSQRKAHTLLHGLFSLAQKRGWCEGNPIEMLDAPSVTESRIEALSFAEINRLLRTCSKPEHRPCAAAVGLMLWAGIRPNEVERLCWGDIKVEDGVISVRGINSKTGGTRHVTLYPILLRWLKKNCHFSLPECSITPRSWERRWRALRRAAGFTHWRADILRHTFASYHVKQFQSYDLLQVDMGHSSTMLLRQRYLGMGGITKECARKFWGLSKAKTHNALHLLLSQPTA